MPKAMHQYTVHTHFPSLGRTRHPRPCTGPSANAPCSLDRVCSSCRAHVSLDSRRPKSTPSVMDLGAGLRVGTHSGKGSRALTLEAGRRVRLPTGTGLRLSLKHATDIRLRVEPASPWVPAPGEGPEHQHRTRSPGSTSPRTEGAARPTYKFQHVRGSYLLLHRPGSCCRQHVPTEHRSAQQAARTPTVPGSVSNSVGNPFLSLSFKFHIPPRPHAHPVHHR